MPGGQTVSFIHDDFLLKTGLARRLYHEVAEPLPIIDYHCHLPPGDVAGNRRFANLAEIWLEGDHYKWRAMRVQRRAENVLHRRRPTLRKVPRVGARPCPTPCATRSTTGRTWS